jgi:hypothetical protein
VQLLKTISASSPDNPSKMTSSEDRSPEMLTVLMSFGLSARLFATSSCDRQSLSGLKESGKFPDSHVGITTALSVSILRLGFFW